MSVPMIDRGVWLRNVWRNRIQSLVLLSIMAGFLALLGWMLWGESGIWLLLAMGILIVATNPSLSPGWVMRMYRARLISPQLAPHLYYLFQQLAERADIATPKLYYIPSRTLNAFTVGRRGQAVVAISDGLIRNLESRELIGVLAHELSHIRNDDLWVMSLADLFSRLTILLSLLGQLLLLLNLPLIMLAELAINWFAILLLISAPTLSALAQLALSRTREFDADLNGAWLAGDADGLASALVKIEQIQGGWLERIFMPGDRMSVPSLLRTHPDTQQRVARLMALKSRLIDERKPLDLDNSLDWDDLLGKPVTRTPKWHINGLWH